MIRLHAHIGLRYEVEAPGADFIFNIQAARTAQQQVVSERLTLEPARGLSESADGHSGNRVLRLSAPAGRLEVTYQCTVDVHHHRADPERVTELPLAELPDAVLPFLYPSRYCQSDALGPLVMDLFGNLPRGYRRVQAVQDWVQRQVAFKSNTSHSGTSALDTLRDRQGVCRDFAHLMIALCRALNIPARFTTGIDYGADPALGPPDFHAYVEVYLGGAVVPVRPVGHRHSHGVSAHRHRVGCVRRVVRHHLRPLHRPPPEIRIRAEPAEAGFEQPHRVAWALSTSA